MSVRERVAIALLEELLTSPNRAVPVGIGDDAAVVASTGEKLVWTVDACVEHVHFERRWLSLADVGWRSLQAAASDIAAMGARPIAALSSLVLPGGTDRRQLRAIGRGQAAAAAKLLCPIVGGNVSSGDALSVTTTVLGRAERPLLRSGARPGQTVWLIGELGLAAAGLRLLQSGGRTRTARRARAACLAAWRRPEAQVALACHLASLVTSAIDISDGLSGDCAHLADASGVRIVIEQDALQTTLQADLVTVAPLLGTTPLELALSGGEDYALVVTGPASKAANWMRPIGRVEPGRGVVLEATDGSTSRLSGGFEHQTPPD